MLWFESYGSYMGLHAVLLLPWKLVREILAAMLKLIYYSLAVWSIVTLVAFALKVVF